MSKEKMKTNQPQPELLLLSCLKDYLYDTESREIINLLRAPFDWDALIKLFMYHEIPLILYKIMKDFNLLNDIPKMVSSILENSYFANFYRNIKIWQEFEHILDLAEKEKIRIVPFKGIILSKTIYKDFALRIFADVDLLINYYDLILIRKILINDGYKEIKESDSYVFKKLISPNLYVYLEVHTTFVPARPYKISFPQLWRRTRQCLIGTREIECLSNEDTFCSLVLHLRRHTRTLRLKFIYDIAKSLKLNANNYDWRYIEDLAEKNHFRNCIFFSLYICAELFGNFIEKEIMDKFRPGRGKERLMHFCFNKNNFLRQKLWRGYLLRLLLFDKNIDLIIYLLYFRTKIKK